VSAFNPDSFYDVEMESSETGARLPRFIFINGMGSLIWWNVNQQSIMSGADQ